MSELYQLPDGWAWQQLKNLTDFENGDRGKNYPSKDAFVDKGIPVISATNLNGCGFIRLKFYFRRAIQYYWWR
jgi:type I restriction enzyme S subunit